MREVFNNAYQVFKTIIGRTHDDADIIQDAQDDYETSQALSADRAFGRLALRSYQNGQPHEDYELIIGDLKFDMQKRGLKIGDLCLSDYESEQLRNLTGLE